MSDPKSFDFNDHAEIARDKRAAKKAKSVKDNIKPREAVEIFAGKMEKRLQEKDEKYGISGWLEEDCDIEYLVEKLDNCSLEIKNAEEDFRLSNEAWMLSALEKKCVDIANFAMMISDKIRHESETGRS